LPLVSIGAWSLITGQIWDGFLWGFFMRRILSISLILFLVFCGIIISTQGNFLGYKLLVVISGSMEPDVPVGAIIGVKAVPPDAIELGDVITYKESSTSALVTHRVVSIDKDNNFITKGDANEKSDPDLVYSNSLIGKTFFVLPYLGYLVIIFHNQYLLLIPIMLIAILLVKEIIAYRRKIFKQKMEEPFKWLDIR